MRISRTCALLMVATLSLGTIAFAQDASFGSLTGEFQSAPVNSIPNNGSNGRTNASTEPNSQSADIGSLTGEFESAIANRPSNQPALTGADADALARKSSEGFSSLTGEFEAAIGNPSDNMEMNSGVQTARKSASQPGSMGSNADDDPVNEDSGAPSSSSSAAGTRQ